MKKLLFILTLAVSTAFADNWTGQRLGNFDYWSSPNGANYSGQQIGNFYYWNGYDQNGQYHSGSGQRIGNFTYWNQDQ